MKASMILGLFGPLAMVAATPTPMPMPVPVPMPMPIPNGWGHKEIIAYFEKWAPTQAYVEFNTEKIKGHVVLTQISEELPIIITWDIQGLDANSKRGFHVHESGNLENGNCTLAGGHYNPFNKEHGGPTDQDRHVGDLGNIDVNAAGTSRGVVTDPLVKLTGPQAVMGRSIVVHAGQDDLGKGDTADSKTTGNAGARPACGVILHGGRSL